MHGRKDLGYAEALLERYANCLVPSNYIGFSFRHYNVVPEESVNYGWIGFSFRYYTVLPAESLGILLLFLRWRLPSGLPTWYRSRDYRAVGTVNIA